MLKPENATGGEVVKVMAARMSLSDVVSPSPGGELSECPRSRSCIYELVSDFGAR
jgi:hypothetical protein